MHLFSLFARLPIRSRLAESFALFNSVGVTERWMRPGRPGRASVLIIRTASAIDLRAVKGPLPLVAGRYVAARP